ncbi:MAG: arsenate reductase ArsC [Acidobacteriota bacterium]|nr:arsenate reductase ArsC [Acidobacteriota bacterium]
MNEKKRVLILCTGNSARSQMAEGILRHAGGGKFEVESAGIAPSRVRPEAIEVMKEIGIDISSHRSKAAAEFVEQNFDYIITVCDNAKETCPFFPGNSTRIHQSFEDPPAPGVGSDESRLAIFRQVRDEIRGWLREFISDTAKQN